MDIILSVAGVSKTYASGQRALEPSISTSRAARSSRCSGPMVLARRR
jgi:hypothetical protein